MAHATDFNRSGNIMDQEIPNAKGDREERAYTTAVLIKSTNMLIRSQDKFTHTMDRFIEGLAQDRSTMREDLSVIKQQLSGLTTFVDGGARGHLGERLARWDEQAKTLDEDMTALNTRVDKAQAEHHRLLWFILVSFVTAVGALAGVLFQHLNFK